MKAKTKNAAKKILGDMPERLPQWAGMIEEWSNYEEGIFSGASGAGVHGLGSRIKKSAPSARWRDAQAGL